MTLEGSFQSYTYAVGRKRSLQHAALLLQRYVDERGLPSLSEQEARITALRTAELASSYTPWYLEDDQRLFLESAGDEAGEERGSNGANLRCVRSVPYEDRPAALALAARSWATLPDSVASWIAAADEHVDPATGAVRTTSATRKAACALLFPALGELLSHSEHQLVVVGGGGAVEAVCAFSEPPHRSAWTASTPALPSPEAKQPPQHAQQQPHRKAKPHRPPLDPSFSQWLGVLLNTGLLQAKARAARTLADGSGIVRRFELAAAFEAELKARLLSSPGVGGGSVLLTALALAGSAPAVGDGKGGSSPALALLLDALQARADSHGVPLRALASDEAMRLALARHGFEREQDYHMEPARECPLTWSVHVRAAAGQSVEPPPAAAAGDGDAGRELAPGEPALAAGAGSAGEREM